MEKAIAQIAQELASIIPTNCMLVPIPNAVGYADSSLELAMEIFRLQPSCTVEDVIEGNPRRPLYDLKKNNQQVDESLFGFYLIKSIPMDKPVYLVDNVVSSGLTVHSASELIPAANVLVYAIDFNNFENSKYRGFFQSERRSFCRNNGALLPQKRNGPRIK